MRKFLGQNKRLVFTLIQKFRFDKGKRYPLLSERDDIVVIVDEAHRTQYKSLAENMRAGLAATPTSWPLPARHCWAASARPTPGLAIRVRIQLPAIHGRRRHGAAVLREARARGAESRTRDLATSFTEILEEENLDEAQQQKLEKQFATEMEVIKRDDRLDTIAQDIVYHFPRRGYLGKAMVISVDKFTAVRCTTRCSAVEGRDQAPDRAHRDKQPMSWRKRA